MKLANGRPLVKRDGLADAVRALTSPGTCSSALIVGPSESTRITANLAYAEAGVGPERPQTWSTCTTHSRSRS
jgi:hypothetical protein